MPMSARRDWVMEASAAIDHETSLPTACVTGLLYPIDELRPGYLV
jgi:hypothetical protein